MTITEIIGQIINGTVGLLIVGGLMAFIYKRHAEDWEELAAIYGRPWRKALATKHLRSLVLYREGRPARTYPGIVTIGVHADGIALKPIFWLAPFHAPVFIPFSEMSAWKQSWYWDGASSELMFASAPDLQMIMPETQVRWMSSVGTNDMVINDDYVPRDNWPAATMAMALTSLCMLVMMAALFGVKYFRPDLLPGA